MISTVPSNIIFVLRCSSTWPSASCGWWAARTRSTLSSRSGRAASPASPSQTSSPSTNAAGTTTTAATTATTTTSCCGCGAAASCRRPRRAVRWNNSVIRGHSSSHPTPPSTPSSRTRRPSARDCRVFCKRLLRTFQEATKICRRLQTILQETLKNLESNSRGRYLSYTFQQALKHSLSCSWERNNYTRDGKKICKRL